MPDRQHTTVTLSEQRRNVGGGVHLSPSPPLSQRTNPPLGLFHKVLHCVVTFDECQRRAEEAKALAAQTQDLWERETYLRIATQWQLLGSHRAVKEGKPAS